MGRSLRINFFNLLLLTVLTIPGVSQSITNYSFSAYSATFTNLSGGTTPAFSGNNNEGFANAIPIGFDFWYMGTRYTTLSASTNGWMTLGSNITNATPTNNLTSGGTPRPVLAPLWDDLNIQTNSNVTYLTSGTTGTRIFALQYLNIKWQTGAPSNTISFQVRLYEGSGKIEFTYRQETGAITTPSASIGIAATATGSGQFLSVSNTGTSVSSTVEANITAKPISGNTYSFVPPVPPAPVGLTFSTVNNTSMTLNWSDVSSNETGFVIYRSTDNVNYTFATQTPADATSSIQSGLTPNTLYYWRIYAVSEGGLSASPLSGSRTAACTPPAPPVVTTPVNYCQGAVASPLSATGTNLSWGAASGTAGGTATLNANTVYTDNGFNTRKTFFTTNTANVQITSVDYYIPAYQTVLGLVLSIYNSGGTIIATSTTSTSVSANATPVRISNVFNATLPAAGNYSIGVSSGIGSIGADNPTFPITEPTGTIDITSVTPAGARTFNNIQFVNPSSSTAPTPSTATVGTFTYLVSQTIGGCTSPQATITVNVTTPNISQTPTSNLIANYKLNGNANDATNNNPGTLQGSPTATMNRFNQTSSALTLNGSSQYISTTAAYTNPGNFTISLWFKTTTVTGGKLIGFGSSQTGISGQHDRHIYMNNAGQLYFGVYPNSVQTVNSTASYNDNNWHLATATLSSTAGMALYVDGILVGSNPAITTAENYTGYWRIGYDNNNAWTSQPSSFYFNGTLDDVLIYHEALSAAQVATLYNSPDGAGNNGPACVGSLVTLTATTLPGATYSWSGPNGFSSSAQNPSFTYSLAAAGVYTVQVTSAGCTATAYTTLSTSTNAGQWTGNVSTDWNTAGNWCTGVVPTSTTDVVISATAVRMPTISSSSAARNLTINPGATVTTAPGGTLAIAGMLTNNGTMVNNGMTNFNGTTGQQTFSGVTTFTNLTVSNSSGLLLPSAITVSNTVTLAAGILNANNFNINVGGSWLNNASVSAFTAGTSSVTFTAAAAQSIGGTFATTFNNLIVAATTGTLTLGINANIAGNLTVSSGTFDLAAFTANRTTSGGIITVANGALLKIGGTQTFPTNYTTTTLVVASTVAYSGTNQTVTNKTYGNLVLSSASGAAVKTFPGTALSIVGDLSTNVGSGTSVSFTAASNITVGGSATFGASTTFNGGSFSHSVGGSWTNNGTFTGATSTVTFTGAGTTVGGTGIQNFNNLTVAASSVNFSTSTLTLTGNLATTGSGSFSQASGGTLIMSGASKTISGTGISLDNLTISGSVTTAVSLTVTGNLSVTGSFTASTGTITMSGAAKSISGAGTISISLLSIPASASVTATSNFTIASGLLVGGTFSASAGTATFTGTSSLSGTANLFNVTINGTSLQLSANSTLGIASTLTVTAGALNATTSSPTTVNFNGTGAQSVNALTYYHLNLSNSSTKTAAGALDILGNITIESGATFNPSTFTHSVYGNWTNNGTFNAGTSTVQFVGSATSYLSGATTFNILTSNTTGAGTELILQSNVTAATVNMTNGIIETGSNTLNITNTRNGPGYIYGNIQRTHGFTTGTAYAFEGPNNTITYGSNTLTSVTVSVVRAPIGDFPSGSSISREYVITPAGSYTSYILRLHYEDSELNGNNESTMGLWHNSGSGWSAVGANARSTTLNYVEFGISGGVVAGRWTLAGNISVAQWNGSVSSDWNTASNWTVLAGSASRPPGPNDIAYLGTAAFTNQPTILSPPPNVKNIIFGSVQPVTLSLTGGSLTTGDIRGDWSAGAAHSINVGSQTLTVNGDFDLSDGTVGRVINLSIGTGTVTVTGSLEESGGAAITFASAGNLNIAQDFNYINGTFTRGTGTVTYNGTVNQTIGAVAYHNLTINKSAGLASIETNLSISGNLTLNAGELDNFATTIITGNVTIGSGTTLLNNSILQVGGDWNNSGIYTSNGSIIFNGTGPQSISATTFGNLEFNKPVGSVATLTGNVTLKGNLIGTSGTLDIGTFLFNRDVVGGSATLTNNGTLIIGANNAPTRFSSYSLGANSTVIFNGSSTQILLLPGVTYGNITFRNSGQKLLQTPITVTGKLLIESGATLDGGTNNTITLNGDWQNDGTFNPASSTVLAAGTAKSIIGNTTFNQMTVTGSYTILNNVTYNGLLNITSTGSLLGGSAILTTLHGDLINSGILNTTGTTTFSGNVLQTLSLINAVQTVAVTVNFNGSVSPVLNSTSTPQYGFLNINNTGGVNPSVDWNILFALTVGTGASFNTGPTTQNIFGSITNNGTITSNGTINIIPTGSATINLGANFTSTGLVVYGGSGALTLAGPAVSFNNVTVSNTHVSGITPAANWTVGNNFTLATGSTFQAGSHSYTVGGSFTSTGTLNSGTSTFTFNGTGAQNISTSSAFNTVSINNGTGSITLLSNVTVNGALNFTTGRITTGTNTLIQPASGTVNGASQLTGWVNGNLQKAIGTGAVSKVFEIGDASSYTPVLIFFPAVSSAGDLKLSTTTGDHPLLSNSTINPARSVNRYWTLVNSGIVFTTYTVTPNWRGSDIDAGSSTALFKVALLDEGVWTLPATASPTATSIEATGVTIFGDLTVGQICNAGTLISYDASPYCSAGGSAIVTHSGTTGGTFSSSAGLVIDSNTGDINLAGSTPGSYVVQYTVSASGGCSAFATSANITITAEPAASISYAGDPYCSSGGTAAITLIGTAGGTFSSVTGLIINASTGLVDLTNSTAGTYNVMYSIAASGGCGSFITSTSITITTQPYATGTYEGNPYCSNGGFAIPTGTAVGLAGTVSATPAGLAVDPATGVIDLGASIPGTYTTAYTVPASGGCATYSITSTVAITALPAATISYTGTPLCSTAGPVAVNFSGTTGGTYSASPSGLAIDPVIGTITPGASTGNTYTVTYTMAGGNGCAQQTATTSVTVTTAPNATIAYTGSPYVIGGGVAAVTLTGGPAGGTYTSTTGLVINATTGTVNLTTSTPGTYTVTYTVAAAGGCALYTTTATIILNLNLKVWDGGAGTVNWGDANNWDTDGIPTATDNVELTGAYSIVVNVPAVARSLTMNHTGLNLTVNSGNSLAVSGNLTITAGTLNINGNGLSLTGDWVNNGNVVTNSSMITLNGTTTQLVSGSSVTNFYNLHVTNTASPGARIQSNQNLLGVLTLNNNVLFDADGSSNTSIFTLISGGDEPTADAAIGILPAGAQVAGNITVQRFMTRQGGNQMRIYRYISSPVQSATVADIQNEIPVTGSFTGASVCSGCLTNQSMFLYDESVITDNNGTGTADKEDGYIDFPANANTETLLPGRGYTFYSRGNILASTLWDVRGQINTGNTAPVTLPVSYTSSGVILDDGWNLVGNPFPSTIDWNAAGGWTKVNLDGSIYISDNGTAASLQYATWNGVIGTNGGSRYISTAQAFWVKANGSGTPILQATEDVKTPGTQTTFFRQGSINNVLRITLQQGTTRDEAVIHFREDALRKLDTQTDAWKLRNGTFNLSTLAETNESLAINSWSQLVCGADVRLNITDAPPGSYSLKFTNLDSFIEGEKFILADNFLQTTTPVTNNLEHVFTITSDPLSSGKARFVLQISKTPHPIPIQESDGVLSVDYASNIQWYFNDVLIPGANSSSLTATETGTYRVDVISDGCALTGSMPYIITGTERELDGLHIFPNPVTGDLFLVSDKNFIKSVTITNTAGKVVGKVQVSDVTGSQQVTFSMADQASGIYILEITTDQNVYRKKIAKK